jgi:hypothetical protein
MRRFILITLISLTVFKANAQSSNSIKTDTLPNFYLGIGTGMNNYTGLLGLSINLRLQNKVFFQGGLGIGTWGSKYTIGLRLDRSYGKGWSYGIGFSSCSGLRDFKTNLELQSGIKQDVTLDLLRANTLNLKATHNWMIHKRNTFYVDLGYAIALQSSPWKVTDGSEISTTSKSALDMLAPGGVILGLGFTFGL